MKSNGVASPELAGALGAPARGGTLIELRGVSKIYRLGKVTVPAVADVSFEIAHGEIVAIMGPSGSGKSSIMNILGCLDRPTCGSYILDGEDVARMNDGRLAEVRRSRIGFVFQQFHLMPRISAAENVELPLLYSRGEGRRRRALEALDRVHLAQRAKHKPTELSGGEQQRVAIARALINNPSLILADEPTGNLDSRVGKEIIALFQQLNREGITVILVTHDMEVAGAAGRVIGMRDGAVVSDTLRPLSASPGTPGSSLARPSDQRQEAQEMKVAP